MTPDTTPQCSKCKGKGYVENERFDKHDGNEYEPAGEYVTLYRNPCPRCEKGLREKTGVWNGGL